MYIIFLLFESQIFLLITILILINKFKYLIGFQLLMIIYLIFKHYSTLLNTYGYLYITFKHYNTKPKKQINKKEYYCTHKAHVISLVIK